MKKINILFILPIIILGCGNNINLSYENITNFKIIYLSQEMVKIFNDYKNYLPRNEYYDLYFQTYIEITVDGAYWSKIIT